MTFATTLFEDDIDGHRVTIRQRMMDASPTSAQWEGAGPFVAGLKYAEIDGQTATTAELRALLLAGGRADLIRQFAIP